MFVTIREVSHGYVNETMGPCEIVEHVLLSLYVIQFITKSVRFQL